MEGTIEATDQRDAGADSVGEPLTFEALNRRLSSMPEYDAPSPHSRLWSRVGLGFAVFSYLAALVVPRLSTDKNTQAVLLLGALVIEVVGLLTSLWFTRGEFASVLRPVKALSKQLDHDFPYHFEVREWLTAQPIDTLEKYASMAAFRRERYTQKLPMLAGAIPTLGIIPVLVAIYFQGRQLMDGRHLSWVDWLFGFALLLFYVLSWTSAMAKSRLEAMDMHFQGALAEVLKNAATADNTKA